MRQSGGLSPAGGWTTAAPYAPQSGAAVDSRIPLQKRDLIWCNIKSDLFIFRFPRYLNNLTTINEGVRRNRTSIGVSLSIFGKLFPLNNGFLHRLPKHCFMYFPSNTRYLNVHSRVARNGNPGKTYSDKDLTRKILPLRGA